MVRDLRHCSQCAVLAGVLVCVGMIAAAVRFRRYMDLLPKDSGVSQFTSPDEFGPVLVILAALVFTGVGTFEIARVFTFEPWGTGFESPRQMGNVSITAFWAINAVGLWLGARTRARGPRRIRVDPLPYRHIEVRICRYSPRYDCRSLAVSARRVHESRVPCGSHRNRRVVRLRGDVSSPTDGAGRRGRTTRVLHSMLVWGAILSVWLPTFEIMRSFRFEPFRRTLRRPGLGDARRLVRVLGRSAVALLAIGFARRIAPLRYLAIALFGVTIIKVFVVDLANLETVYRIVSFIVLGVLLLAASFLYQQLSADTCQTISGIAVRFGCYSTPCSASERLGVEGGLAPTARALPAHREGNIGDALLVRSAARLFAGIRSSCRDRPFSDGLLPTLSSSSSLFCQPIGKIAGSSRARRYSAFNSRICRDVLVDDIRSSGSDVCSNPSRCPSSCAAKLARACAASSAVGCRVSNIARSSEKTIASPSSFLLPASTLSAMPG